MRVVLDPNVLVSAVLSRSGAPAQLVAHWLAGELEVVVSDALLAELERALGYPKLRSRVSGSEAAEIVALLREAAHLAADPVEPAARSPDPGDDYLIALAEAERALLVSGDSHLLGLRDRYPIRSPRELLEELGASR